MLPWFESLARQCQIDREFTEKFPELKILPDGCLKLFFSDKNHLEHYNNLIEEEITKEESFTGSKTKISDKKKLCFH